MIICPWCGTNYEVFQSNCKNCGGPIQLPMQAMSVAEEAAPVLPPPAPRSISDSYIRQLMMSDGAAITGMVFAILGTVFSIVGLALTLGIITAFIGVPFAIMGVILLVAGGGLLYWRYQAAAKTVNVLRCGEAVLGEITGVEQNLSVSVSNRHPWVVAYQYRINGQDYSGKVSTFNELGPMYQPGKSVYALYLPDAPQRSAIYPHP